MARDVWYRIPTVAKRLGVTKQQVQLLIRAEKLPARLTWNPLNSTWAWRVNARVLRQYITERTFCPTDLRLLDIVHRLGLSRATVGRAVHSGKLKAHSHGGRWAV